MSKCGKVGYKMRRAQQLASSAVDTKGTYEAYLCFRCNKWHIGHNVMTTSISTLQSQPTMKDKEE